MRNKFLLFLLSFIFIFVSFGSLKTYAKNIDEDINKTYTKEIDNYKIIAKVPIGAFNEDVFLEVKNINENKEELKEEVAKNLNEIVIDLKLFDISFINSDKKEVEPNKNVNIEIITDEKVKNDFVIHKKDDGKIEKLSASYKENNEKTHIKFETESFSTFGVPVITNMNNPLVTYNLYNQNGTIRESHQYKELSFAGKTAFCVDFGKDMYTGLAYTEKPITDVFNETLVKDLGVLLVMYEIRVGHPPNYQETQSLFWSSFTGTPIVANTIKDWRSVWDAVTDFKRKVAENSSEIRDLRNAVDIRGTIAIPNNGNHLQRLINIVYGHYPNGDLEITKRSGNPFITNGNACYSLEGAVFRITKVTNPNVRFDLRTNNTGWVRINDIPIGEYRVEEIQAPRGYVKNPNIPNVYVNSKSQNNNIITRIEVMDSPKSDPLPISIIKKDSENNNVPSLEGAEFTVKFYDRHFDNNIVVGSPTKTWVFATKYDEINKIYRTRTNKFYKIRGDELFERGFPLGTITIEETKAPKGYVRDERVFVKKVEEQGDIAVIKDRDELIGINQEYTLPNKVIEGKIRIKKWDKDLIQSTKTPQGGASLLNTRFQIISKNDDILFNGKHIKRDEPVEKVLILSQVIVYTMYVLYNTLYK